MTRALYFLLREVTCFLQCTPTGVPRTTALTRATTPMRRAFVRCTILVDQFLFSCTPLGGSARSTRFMVGIVRFRCLVTFRKGWPILLGEGFHTEEVWSWFFFVNMIFHHVMILLIGRGLCDRKRMIEETCVLREYCLTWILVIHRVGAGNIRCFLNDLGITTSTFLAFGRLC